MPEKPTCQYCSEDGERCQEIDMGSGYCFWHDPKFDKSGLDLKDKLERYAHNGGLMQGLKLRRANLEGLNLVRRDASEGYNLAGSDFYRANLKNAHLFNTRIENGSLMKADLSNANLHCCKLEGTNLLGTKLTDARIDNIEIGDQLIQEKEADQAKKQKNREQELDLYEQSEEIYRDLHKAAEQQGLYELAGKFTHKELIMRRYRYKKWSKPRLVSKFIDLFCGYGEKP